MRSDFKAKLIAHMLNKKGSEKGFTLIELLVVIIIIGILAAIALPSFLNQASKARQSEAKTYVGSFNRTQQAYYLEKQEFAPNLQTLNVGVPQITTNYVYGVARNGGKAAAGTLVSVNNYGIPAGTVTTAGTGSIADALTGIASAAIKTYVGGVNIATPAGNTEATTLASLCEANLAAVNGGSSVAQSLLAANWSITAAPTCPGFATTGGTNYSAIN